IRLQVITCGHAIHFHLAVLVRSNDWVGILRKASAQAGPARPTRTLVNVLHAAVGADQEEMLVAILVIAHNGLGTSRPRIGAQSGPIAGVEGAVWGGFPVMIKHAGSVDDKNFHPPIGVASRRDMPRLREGAPQIVEN